jgi:uncharacterized protein
MIIDGHAHACGDYLTPESIEKTLTANGADKVLLAPGELNSAKAYSMPVFSEWFPEKNAVKVTNVMTRLVVTLSGSADQILAGNEYVYGLTQKCPECVLQCLWVTRQLPDPVEYLDKKLEAWKFKCVKIHQVWEDVSVDSTFFRETAGWAESHSIPLFIHLASDKEALKLVHYKKEHGNLKLIVAHMFGLEFFISEGVKDENLYFDTSSVQFTSTYRVKKAIDFVGADRVLLGTDTPYGEANLKLNLARIRSLDLSKDDKQKILGGNLKDLLEI